ncbi:MAG: hypothetical protein KAG56_06150 [Sulfurovaceae bacterium]|nr:hypothetical protein [Sulfurovaceae bacterium]
MVRFLIIVAMSLNIMAQSPTPMLQKNCIVCHVKQKIPSELIYRRYLMRYSTHNQIRKTLLAYLKSPKKEHSIMPKQFFLKFPPKEPMEINESFLIESIDAYLDYFDIKRKFIYQE